MLFGNIFSNLLANALRNLIKRFLLLCTTSANLLYASNGLVILYFFC